LLTVCARSTLKRSRPRSAATTSAAMLLPVPGSPANRAVTPGSVPTPRACGRDGVPVQFRLMCQSVAQSAVDEYPLAGHALYCQL